MKNHIEQTFLARVAAILIAGLCWNTSHAATVTGTIVNTGGTPLVTNVVFAPLSTPQAAGADTVPSTVGAVTTGADGGFSIALNAGDYKVTVGGAARDSFIIAVPAGNGVYALNSLITSALSYGSSVAPTYEVKLSKGQTNGYAALNTNALVPPAQLGAGTAGTNTFLRGDGVWVANSSGNYVAAGTNTSAQTNSNVVTVNVSVLNNQCTASPSCSLRQVVILPVLPSTLSMSDAAAYGNPSFSQAVLGGHLVGTTCTPGFVQLNGQPQTACGALNPITIVNARGTDAKWDITAQVTDFVDGTRGPGDVCTGAPGQNNVSPLASPNNIGQATKDNHCIPGDNLGWVPLAPDQDHATGGSRHKI